ncbi:hypothetical protein [Streptomyces brevispora]|uniref:hypothetical protein n=1 Tax=Streptomyces brevispora TaxID=887462 RepID=UPI0035E0BAA1
MVCRAIWDGLLGLPPERESRRVTPQDSRLLEKLMKRIGVSQSTAHLRFGDGWRLEPRALDAGPGWEDRLAVRDDGLVQEGGRVRLDLVRQLAEAVRYAHNPSLYHRALSARSVYVCAREDGSDPVLRIADWQTAARDFETSLHRSLGDTPLDGDLIADIAQVYLAPRRIRSSPTLSTSMSSAWAASPISC